VFRTSSSQEEGGERAFALMTTKLSGHEGRIDGLRAVRVELKDGRLMPLPEREVVLPVDLLILAMGFVGPDSDAMVEQLGMQLDGRGNLATRDYATTADGVFAAGDARRGQSLIVWAIAEGRGAAAAIDAHLRG
jgi:glutamate synthase (NADPH/NADH) small chain